MADGDTILVVDDEEAITEIVKFNLEQAGYEVLTALDGSEAVTLALRENPSLVVLDIMLPEMDGFDVCRKIRDHSAVPILMLTAKEEETDKVRGLELGADDYVTKPFSPRELVARVRALIRRAHGAMNGMDPDEDRIHCDDFIIHLDRREVTKAGRTIALTQREFDLLCYLAEHPGRVFSREDLLREVWDYEYFGDIRTVDVTVRRLREKIEEEPSDPHYVLTKRGAGYLFRRF